MLTTSPLHHCSVRLLKLTHTVNLKRKEEFINRVVSQPSIVAKVPSVQQEVVMRNTSAFSAYNERLGRSCCTLVRGCVLGCGGEVRFGTSDVKRVAVCITIRKNMQLTKFQRDEAESDSRDLKSVGIPTFCSLCELCKETHEGPLRSPVAELW